jgi:hypothetical protein
MSGGGKRGIDFNQKSHKLKLPGDKSEFWPLAILADRS